MLLLFSHVYLTTQFYSNKKFINNFGLIILICYMIFFAFLFASTTGFIAVTINVILFIFNFFALLEKI